MIDERYGNTNRVCSTQTDRQIDGRKPISSIDERSALLRGSGLSPTSGLSSRPLVGPATHGAAVCDRRDSVGPCGTVWDSV